MRSLTPDKVLRTGNPSRLEGISDRVQTIKTGFPQQLRFGIAGFSHLFLCMGELKGNQVVLRMRVQHVFRS